ncbi:MAG: hypothetical protein WA156_09435, partial [Methylocystis silviterrae]
RLLKESGSKGRLKIERVVSNLELLKRPRQFRPPPPTFEKTLRRKKGAGIIQTDEAGPSIR